MNNSLWPCPKNIEQTVAELLNNNQETEETSTVGELLSRSTKYQNELQLLKKKYGPGWIRTIFTTALVLVSGGLTAIVTAPAKPDEVNPKFAEYKKILSECDSAARYRGDASTEITQYINNHISQLQAKLDQLKEDTEVQTIIKASDSRENHYAIGMLLIGCGIIVTIIPATLYGPYKSYKKEMAALKKQYNQ